MHNKLQICKVCGLFYPDFYPWGEFGDCPSFDICICCGTEFGYHDATLQGMRNKRAAWISAGAKWDMIEYKPQGWVLEDQLTNIPDDYK